MLARKTFWPGCQPVVGTVRTRAAGGHQCRHPAGQQALQPELAPLRMRERRAAIQHRVRQYRTPPGADPYRIVLGRRAEFVRCVQHRYFFFVGGWWLVMLALYASALRD